MDEQLALALAKNKEYNAKAKKLKRLEAKLRYIAKIILQVL